MAVKFALKKCIIIELKIVLVCGFVQKKMQKKKCKFFFFVKMKENSEKGGVVHFFLPIEKKSRCTFSILQKKKVFNEPATFTFFHN